MEYYKTIKLKDGRTCILRNCTAEDGRAVLDVFDLGLLKRVYLNK